ncbi:MAG TPA: cytochrome c oxidase subunit II [Bacillota bacterium]
MGVALPLVIALIAVIGAAVVASGVWWLPPLASNWTGLDNMILITTLVTGVVFVVTHLVLAYLVFRYRRNRAEKADYIDDNPRLERWLLTVTALIIAAMLVPGLFAYGEVVAQPGDALVVEVLGEQWRWNYRFPGADGTFGRTDVNLITSDNVFGLDLSDPAAADDVVLVGEALYLPVNQPVRLQFRSKDVLHNFWVPEFRVKIDAVPGTITESWIVPAREGTFQAACAEYCGIAHYVMVSDIHVVDAGSFEQWLSERPTAADTLR